jgi:hypothetical protein
MKRILLIVLGVLLLAGMAQAQVPVTYPSAYPGNVFEFLLNRAIDSPPYTKGHTYTSTSGTTITLTFATAEGKAGYYCWTYVMLPLANTGDVTIIKTLGGVSLEVITAKPGATIADFVACDVLVLTKTVAADVVYYGGYYNR